MRRDNWLAEGAGPVEPQSGPSGSRPGSPAPLALTVPACAGGMFAWKRNLRENIPGTALPLSDSQPTGVSRGPSTPLSGVQEGQGPLRASALNACLGPGGHLHQTHGSPFFPLKGHLPRGGV